MTTDSVEDFIYGLGEQSSRKHGRESDYQQSPTEMVIRISTARIEEESDEIKEDYVETKRKCRELRLDRKLTKQDQEDNFKLNQDDTYEKLVET